MLVAFSPAFVSDKCKFWLQFRSSFIKLAMFNCVLCNMPQLEGELGNIISEKHKLFLEKDSSKLLASRNLEELEIISEY